MSNEITYEKWEEYLRGNLDQEQKTQLDSALQKDEDLQRQLALYEEVRTTMQDEQLTVFQQTLQQVQQEQKKAAVPNRPPRQISYRWVAVAAAAVGLAILGWILLRSDAGANTPSELYAQYAQHEIKLQEMSSDPDLGIIQSLLQEKKYAEALPRITTYISAHPEAADVQLAQAIAQLETNNSEQALQTLATLEASHPIYINEARWYRALTHLKMEQLMDARAALLTVPDSSSRYEEAQALLRKISE